MATVQGSRKTLKLSPQEEEQIWQQRLVRAQRLERYGAKITCHEESNNIEIDVPVDAFEKLVKQYEVAIAELEKRRLKAWKSHVCSGSER